MPGLAAVSLAIMVSLVLIARPTHELPPLPPMAALLPSAAVEPPVVEEGVSAELPLPSPPVHAAPVARAPRHSRIARRAPGIEATRASWLPSARSRVSVPVSWTYASYRPVAPREVVQSP